ncbi:uncharacterized protein LOC143632230 [Bidens hawaiensis]|uniref:uncharacterized protein LOC143632230 n=1 Tax=Bidens hawaiensis TaxID=980011 RepID=UPI004049CCD4
MSNANQTGKETTSGSFQCPRLTKTNYTSWSMHMEVIFGIHGVWDVIDPGSNDVKKNNIAKTLLFQLIPEEQILQIGNFKLAKEMWDAIKSRYMGAERVKDARLHMLIREFDGLMMKETETIDVYASRITTISSKATTLGQPYEERRLVQKFFTSLPSRFIQVVASFEQVLDLKTVGFEDVVGRFHANRVGVTGKVRTEDMVVDVVVKTMVHKEGLMKGINERCPERRKDKQANLANAKEKDPSLYMVRRVQEKMYLNEQKVIPKDYEGGSDEQDLWYLDNGASNHMTGNVSFFSELNKRVGGKVKFGDGSYVDICEKGYC